jgi:hypothetical protein
MERQFGLITRLRVRRDRPATGSTVHVYRRLAPFSATLCGEVIAPGDRSWGEFGTPLASPPLEAVDCGRCRAYLARASRAGLSDAV